MNQPIRRLSLVVALLFSTLLISTTWIQFVMRSRSMPSRATGVRP
jgi:hypothetical protein